MATLYLIPVPLGEVSHQTCLPEYNRTIVQKTKHFIVENVRSARRFLKAVDKAINIDELSFYELNKHTSPDDIHKYLSPLKAGEDVGIISEAGCPAVADPGADLVALAHQSGFEVRPLIGPSSIMLALMASGANGQNFTFKGYLPSDKTERIQSLKLLEQQSKQQNSTILLIETPYRNNALLSDAINILHPRTRLCIACDLTLPTQQIISQTIDIWHTLSPLPDLKKRPTIFVLHA